MSGWIQRHFYVIQIALGAAFLWALWWRVRKSDAKPFFRTSSRSSDRPSRLSTHHPQHPKKPPLALPGIALSGKPHEILGVPEHATHAEIQTAFRALMKRFHPDRVPTAEAKRISQIIIQARQTLEAQLEARLNPTSPRRGRK